MTRKTEKRVKTEISAAFTTSTNKERNAAKCSTNQ